MKLLGSNHFESIEVDPKNNTFTIEDQSFHINDVQLDTPINGTVYGTLLNYKGALEQLGSQVHEKPYVSPPKAPILYIKPANTLNRQGEGIPIPPDVMNL